MVLIASTGKRIFWYRLKLDLAVVYFHIWENELVSATNVVSDIVGSYIYTMGGMIKIFSFCCVHFRSFVWDLIDYSVQFYMFFLLLPRRYELEYNVGAQLKHTYTWLRNFKASQKCTHHSKVARWEQNYHSVFQATNKFKWKSSCLVNTF